MTTRAKVGWVAGVLAAIVAVFTLAGTAARLPDGYAEFQSASAAKLSRQPAPRLHQLRHGTGRDLFAYIPLYLGGGLVIVAAVQQGLWRGRRPSPLVPVAVVLAGAAAADVVETLLFRTSLDRLINGGGEPAIHTLVAVTRTFTGIKAVAGLAAAGLLGRLIWQAPAPLTRRSRRSLAP